MAEISNLYDPKPAVPTLKAYSAISITFEVWRCEVNKYRTRNELKNLNPKVLHTSLREKLPDLPTAIYDTIEEYVKNCGRSVENWLKQHYPVFVFYYGHRNYVLYNFDDFVCDSTGGIDYVKTAERMMRCDRFTNVEKFKVACMYCFEDDVRRIWPSVWRQVGLDQIRFEDCPQLYYWICRLNNALNEIRLQNYRSIDEKMFDACHFSNRTTWEYFWNRLSSEVQVQKTRHQSTNILLELILPKWNEQQIDEFVKLEGCGLIYSYITNDGFEEGLFLGIWMYIKSVLNEDVFGELIVLILKFENKRETWRSHSSPDWGYREYEKNRSKKWLCRSREVWSCVPHNLRISVIKNILLNLRLYESDRNYTYEPSNYEGTNENPVNSSEFLYTILSDASLEDRYSFWCNCWHNLILGTNHDDLQRIMEKCFENNDAIVEFKENVIARSEIVRQICVSLLTHAHFEELNELMDFCFPNEDSAKNRKQQLLQSSFLSETSIFRYTYFRHAKRFDKFISDAYGNVDLATDFKYRLMSSPATELILPKDAFASRSVRIDEFIEFMELFVSTEEMMQQKKMRMFDHLREVRCTNPHYYANSYSRFLLLGHVLLWCLGSPEKVAKFNENPKSFIF